MNKRKFSGSCVPLGTPLGKVLINSSESKELSRLIRSLKQGETKTLKLSPETKQRINKIR